MLTYALSTKAQVDIQTLNLRMTLDLKVENFMCIWKITKTKFIWIFFLIATQ